MRLAYPGRNHYVIWGRYEWSSIWTVGLSQTPVDEIYDGLVSTLRQFVQEGSWYPLRDVDEWYTVSKAIEKVFSS